MYHVKLVVVSDDGIYREEVDLLDVQQKDQMALWGLVSAVAVLVAQLTGQKTSEVWRA